MNSEVWICLDTEERSLPFALAAAGYDVWMGNSCRKKKSVHSGPNSPKFCDFSIDEARHLWFHWIHLRKDEGIYIGHSAGFSCLEHSSEIIHPKLNDQVKVFIGLTPALSLTGLAAPRVDGLMKLRMSSDFAFFYLPLLMFIHGPLYSSYFFGRKSITGPSVFNSAFLKYNDSVISPSPPPTHRMRFPTKNITTPIVLIWGNEDSLVDIEKNEAAHQRGWAIWYEHLDLLWGKDTDKDVIPIA
jgi:lysosomal acid lipase/cholesteryl ester hydrolase